jgi:hypothetical protein
MRKLALVVASCLSLSLVVVAEEMGGAPTPAPEIISDSVSDVSVIQSALGTGVDRETRTIQGEAESFDSAVSVHYLTRVKSDSVPTTIHHVYSVDGKEIVAVPLSVKGSPWTTWSHKTVWPGSWKVEVKDDGGKVIESKMFTVSDAMDSSETTPAVEEQH